MKPYILGIDLGTSNSAVSLAEMKSGEVKSVKIFQQVSHQSTGEHHLLPSILYLPTEDEAEFLKSFPWSEQLGACVLGSFAKEQASRTPDRVITSAKSWLCQKHVDREAEILPWAVEIEGKMSPITAGQRLLAHMIASFEAQHKGLIARHEYSVVITVPASFDEVARNLTLRAAHEAGIEDVILLEEPQAALYAWLNAHQDNWRDELQAGDIVLVCDIGGGTADFSLVAVTESGGNLHLERISVGEHILLGGDNMDLALAYLVSDKLEADGTELDRYQMLSMIHQARNAKERLLSDEQIDFLPVAVASASANLFASTVSTEISRADVRKIIIEGFFPLVGDKDRAHEKREVGLHEFGLPFAQDAAITRHLASFLAMSRANVLSDPEKAKRLASSIGPQLMKPSKVLFNGGVCYALEIKERILDQLERWTGEEAVELAAVDYDLAVSRGAAYFGMVNASGEGLRIKAGAATSFYIGIESSGLAVPGLKPQLKALCLVPQGAEEGSEFELESRQFGLVVGDLVKFRCFVSKERAGDKFSTTLTVKRDELTEIAALETIINMEGTKSGEIVPVVIKSIFNTVGVLEIWLVHKPSQNKWKLEFNLRAQR